jgi:hypothetical protein
MFDAFMDTVSIIIISGLITALYILLMSLLPGEIH